MQTLDKSKKPFNFEPADKAMVDMMEHLQANKINTTDLKYHVGRKLTIDPAPEKFINDKEADAMLTREYRKGFVVPEKV